MATELPDNVLALLKQGIPTYAATEALLLIRKVGRFETAAELCAMSLPPTEAREVEGYLTVFQGMGLVRHRGDAFYFNRGCRGWAQMGK